jgi:hypothetical protein
MPFPVKLAKFVATYPEPCLVTAATTLFSAGCIYLGIVEFKNFDPTQIVDTK